MSADDKYPGSSGRRRFVKGVVGGATLAGVGAAGSATVNSLTSSSGAGGGQTQAMAIENIDGPAPRGMPQIPLEIDDQGFIKGVWPKLTTIEKQGKKMKLARTQNFKGTGLTYSQNWFQYCGVESYQGLSPTYDGDNFFRAGGGSSYDWMSNTVSEGDKFEVSHFNDYKSWGNGIGKKGLGKPAMGSWRSQNANDVIPIQLLRSPIIEKLAQTGKAKGPEGPISVNGRTQKWLKASTSKGFIAWLDKCTHFCCVPGWKQTSSSAKFGASDYVYCQCHQSVYNPFSVVETLFVARPRPEE